MRYFHDGDEIRLADLLMAAFPRWPAIDTDVSAIEHLRWKLHSGPDSTRYHIVAELGSRIIAGRFFIPQTAKMGSKVIAVRQGVDTAVHPEFRGHGLMTALTYPMPERIRQGFDADFSVNSDAQALVKMRQYDERDNVYATVEVLRARADAVPHDAVHVAPATVDIDVVGQFDGSVEQFFEQASAPFWFIVRRTAHYLNWRYVDRRAGDFTIKIAKRDGKLLGFVVSKTSGETGYVADLLCLPGCEDVAACLAQDALADFRSRRVDSVEWWSTPSHPYRRALTALGFREKKRTLRFYFQPISLTDDECAPFSDPRSVMHLVAGDTDLI